MRPRVGMLRGTSRDRYITVARHNALKAGMRPGPEQEGPVRAATSA